MVRDFPAASILRVCVVSDVRIYREALAAALQQAGGFEVTILTGAGLAALMGSEALAPRLVVVDMATGDALPLIRSVRWKQPAVRIVAFGVEDSEREILGCAEEGVASYVCRDARTDELADAVTAAARGELVCSRRVAASLFQRVASLARRIPASADTLTSREHEVLRLIRDGLPNKLIAHAMSISETTVKSHVHSVLAKLNVKSRAQAARIDRIGRLRTE